MHLDTYKLKKIGSNILKEMSFRAYLLVIDCRTEQLEKPTR